MQEAKDGVDSMDIVYLGMGYDIITPLNLYPNVDTIYSIDNFDSRYGGTKLEQSYIIMDIIKSGSNDSLLEKIRVNPEKYAGCPCCGEKFGFKKQTLEKKGKIINFLEEPALSRDEPARSIIIFEYNGVERQLIQYYQNYNTTWPIDIKNISGIIGLGSFSLNSFVHPKFIKMLESRTSSTYELIVDAYNHGYGEDHCIESTLRNSSVVIYDLTDIYDFFNLITYNRNYGTSQLDLYLEEDIYREQHNMVFFYNDKIKRKNEKIKRQAEEIKKLKDIISSYKNTSEENGHRHKRSRT